MLPAIIAITTHLEKNAPLLGSMNVITPIWRPTDAKFANPHNAYVDITIDRSLMFKKTKVAEKITASVIFLTRIVSYVPNNILTNRQHHRTISIRLVCQVTCFKFITKANSFSQLCICDKFVDENFNAYQIGHKRAVLLRYSLIMLTLI